MEKWLFSSPLRNANKRQGRFIRSATGNTAASRQTRRTDQMISTKDLFFFRWCVSQAVSCSRKPHSVQVKLEHCGRNKKNICALYCRPSNHLSLFPCSFVSIGHFFSVSTQTFVLLFPSITCFKEVIHLTAAHNLPWCTFSLDALYSQQRFDATLC